MAERWTRRHAVHQAMAVAIALAAVFALVLPHVRAPKGADTLKAEVSTLRSTAAETAVIAEARELTPRFLEAHLQQLGDDAHREHERIAALGVSPHLES